MEGVEGRSSGGKEGREGRGGVEGRSGGKVRMKGRGGGLEIRKGKGRKRKDVRYKQQCKLSKEEKMCWIYGYPQCSVQLALR